MRKIIWTISIIILVIATGIVIYLTTRKSKDFEPMIKDKLQELVKTGSDSLYRLTMDKIEVDVINSTLTVINAHLIPDSSRLQLLEQQQKAPDDIFSISLKALEIKGISPLDLLDKKHIDLQALYLRDPQIQMYHKKRGYNQVKDTTTLYQRLSKQLESFKLSNAEAQHVAVDYYDMDNKNKEVHLKDLTFRFKDILFNDTTQNDASRFLYASDASIFLKDYNLSTADNLYRFNIDSLNIETVTKSVKLWGISMKPIGNKAAFSKKLQFRKDRYDLQAATATIKDADWWGLLSGQAITTGHVDIYKGEVELYSDKALPGSGQNKTGHYPHQNIGNIPIPLFIEKVALHNFEVLYKEFNPKSGQMGTIQFTHVNGTLTNITNRPEKIAANPTFEVNAEARFMDDGELKTTWKFDMAHLKDGLFTVTVDMGKMDGTSLNKATVPLGLFEVKKANIKQFSAFIKGNNAHANGDIKVAYDNLEVSILKKGDEDGELKKKGLMNFIAKTFIFQKENPKKGDALVAKHAYFERAPEKSFFNLLWKTIMTGVVATVKGD
ncbi:hypothetical protein SAMN05421788_108144 [Filimonas lacunae]|uniref:DUF748 domain-containing protein n=1 Tax=Filimonas lacunae TaxID=477680 RepID=A0A173MDV8_9BACT|nr:hypothetical protein [Filimonas lacunae]BAV05707.1 hypothetical protein FLA_1719 [Filimonas lacunae]SIT28833.1 hypothetical protein SAMN05421788_108144 [Filimonas lacunae]